MRIDHPKFLRAGVHALHENFFAACHIFGKRHTAVVGRRHRNAFHQFAHRMRFTNLHVHLTTSHGSGAFRNRNFIVKGDFAVFHGLHHEQHRHDLRYGRKRQLLMCILLKQHLSALRVNQNRALGFDAEGCLRSFIAARHIVYGFDFNRLLPRQLFS